MSDKKKFLGLLEVMVGLPRSGKSTIVQDAIKEGAAVVNPDSIRLAIHGQRFFAPAESLVWAVTKIMIKSLFLAGHTWVVLDATNVTRKLRSQWFSDEWAVRFVEVDTPVEECVRRVQDDPSYAGAEATEFIGVIRRMASEYEKPDLESEREAWAIEAFLKRSA